MTTRLPLLLLALCGVSPLQAAAPADAEDHFLGGTRSIGNELKEATRIDRRSDWDLAALRTRLAERHGLTLSADYATLFQRADDSLSGADHGLGGVLRVYGRWTLLGRGSADTGTLVAKVEHRHRLAITASVQALNDPALYPDAGHILVAGLRARVIFF